VLRVRLEKLIFGVIHKEVGVIQMRIAEFNLLLSHKRNWGQVSSSFHKREGPRHRKTEERRVL
jgi:hypothetical protein